MKPVTKVSVYAERTTLRGQMDDCDIWGTARKMIELYGAKAQSVAMQRGEEALRRGDQKGFRRWNNMSAAISSRALRPTAPTLKLVEARA